MTEPAGPDGRRRAWFMPLVIVLSAACACDRPPGAASADEEPAAYHLASDTESNGARRATPRAAAEADAAGAPSFLPRGPAAGGWIKTQAVRPVSPEVLGARFGPALDRPGVREAYACRYEQESGQTAEVLALRWVESDEAYGAYSVMARGEGGRLTQYARLDTGAAALTLYAWQGEWVIVLRCTAAAGEEAVREAERLLGRMLLAIPAADPPRLVSALAQAGAGAASAVWRSRSVRSVQPQMADVMSRAQAGAVDEVLGLDGSAVLVAGRFPAADAGEFNLVWLVEYANAESAGAAWQRYKEARLDGQRNLPTTILTNPAGRYLLGSWSPEQESTMHVLPRVQHVLSGAR